MYMMKDHCSNQVGNQICNLERKEEGCNEEEHEKKDVVQEGRNEVAAKNSKRTNM
jgi:hypothetical protein